MASRASRCCASSLGSRSCAWRRSRATSSKNISPSSGSHRVTRPRYLGAFERIAIVQKNWALLSQVDTKLGSLTEDASVAAAHQTRLAEALELAADPSALETYRAALARDPENVTAARGLSRLAQRTNVPAVLADAVQRKPSACCAIPSCPRRCSFEVRGCGSRGNAIVAGAATDLEQALGNRAVRVTKESAAAASPRCSVRPIPRGWPISSRTQRAEPKEIRRTSRGAVGNGRVAARRSAG